MNDLPSGRRWSWPYLSLTAAGLALALLWLWLPVRPQPVFKATAVVFGGTLPATLRLVPGPELTVTPAEAAEKAFATIREVDRLLNPLYADSDVRRLNAAKPGELIAVNPLTWRAVLEGLRFNRLSGGAFDLTVDPASKLYKFGKGKASAWPTEKQRHEVMKRVGSQNLILEREGMRIGFRLSGMAITFGAVAQGLALDQAKQTLLNCGVKNFILEAGGEVWGMGQVPEADGLSQISSRPWHSAVRHPRNQKEFLLRLDLEPNCAISTSGDYEKFFTYGGKRYSHIIDARTGLPESGGVISATVISPRSCTEADILATTLSILGEKSSAELLKLFPGAEAYLAIEEQGKLRVAHLPVKTEGANQ